MKKNQVKKNIVEFESRVKMLGAILNNSLLQESKLVKHEYKSSKTSLASEYLEKINIILSNYRALVEKVTSSNINENSKLIIKYGDEYISNVTNYYLIRIYEYLKNED